MHKKIESHLWQEQKTPSALLTVKGKAGFSLFQFWHRTAFGRVGGSASSLLQESVRNADWKPLGALKFFERNYTMAETGGYCYVTGQQHGIFPGRKVRGEEETKGQAALYRVCSDKKALGFPACEYWSLPSCFLSDLTIFTCWKHTAITSSDASFSLTKNSALYSMGFCFAWYC